MKKVFILVCFLLICSTLFAGEVFHIEKSTTVKEDLVLIGKSCIMEGTVNGDIVIINGDLELYGTAQKDVVVLNGGAMLYAGSNIKVEHAVGLVAEKKTSYKCKKPDK